jgi:hypothetical protein
MALPLVLHIPHASSVIPADLRETLLLDDDALRRELLIMTDWHTDRLFAFPGTEAVVHPVSRLICDPERFVDDAREPMASFGMGVVYTRTHRFGILRQPPTQSGAGGPAQPFLPAAPRQAGGGGFRSAGPVRLVSAARLPQLPGQAVAVRAVRCSAGHLHRYRPVPYPRLSFRKACRAVQGAGFRHNDRSTLFGKHCPDQQVPE